MRKRNSRRSCTYLDSAHTKQSCPRTFSLHFCRFTKRRTPLEHYHCWGRSSSVAANYQSPTLVLAIVAALSILLFHGPDERQPAGASGVGSAGISKQKGIPCYWGNVALGGPDGAIDVQVRCKPIEHPEDVGFVVSATDLETGEPRQLKSLRRYPDVLDSAVGSRRGVCMRSRKEVPAAVICEVKASHSVLLKGRVWMRPRETCQVNVEVTPRKPRCQGNCALTYTAVTIARGLPRGC